MSIKYQLYQMSNINQIIISIPNHHSHLHTLQLFSLSPPPLSPPCSPHPPSSLSWKKSSSAFKKYRQRREKRPQPQPPSTYQLQNMSPQQPHQLYTLSAKSQQLKFTRSVSETDANRPAHGYFDPNLAPLCSNNVSDAESVQLHFINPRVKKGVSKKSYKLEEDSLSNIQKRLDYLPIRAEEEHSQQLVQFQRQNDPFIIVRRDSPAITHQSNKTKCIRKQNYPISRSLQTPLAPSSVSTDIIKKQEVANTDTLKRPIRKDHIFTPPLSLGNNSQFIRPLSFNSRYNVIQIESSPSECEGGSWKKSHIIECD